MPPFRTTERVLASCTALRRSVVCDVFGSGYSILLLETLDAGGLALFALVGATQTLKYEIHKYEITLNNQRPFASGAVFASYGFGCQPTA